MTEEHKFPEFLKRGSYHLNRASKSKTVAERVEELVKDEARFFRSVSTYISRVSIPPRKGNSDNDPSPPTEELGALFDLKQRIDAKIGKIMLRIVYINRKRMDMKSTPLSSMPDVPPYRIAGIINILEGYEKQYSSLLKVYHLKVRVLRDNIKALRRYLPPTAPRPCRNKARISLVHK